MDTKEKRKRITIEDIARALGISKATVSVALSGRNDQRISAETRTAVRAKAEELGYVFSGNGRGGAGGRRSLLFLHGDVAGAHVGTSFFVRVAEELRLLGPERGFILIEASGRLDRLSLARMIADFRPAACVTYSELCGKDIRASNPDLPLLVLQSNGEMDFSWEAAYDVDDTQVGVLAAQALLDGGRKRAAVFFPVTEKRFRCQYERLNGFRDTWTAGDGHLELFTLPSLAPAAVERFVAACAHRFPADFDAAYFFSDSAALAGMRALTNRGVAIPRQAAVIGTDNLFWGAFSVPSLSTMELNEKLFARRIADDLDAAGRGTPWSGLSVRIPVSLIRREST